MMSKWKVLTVGCALMIFATAWLVTPAAGVEASSHLDYNRDAYCPPPTEGGTSGGGGIRIGGTPTSENGDPDELTGGNLSVWAPTSPTSQDSSVVESLWQRFVRWIQGSAKRLVGAR